jgi:DNA-binding transcriptional ArsR family regulator
MVNNVAEELDRSFGALAHPIRRAIVQRLAGGPATVGEATGDLPVSKPAITKHLRVLEEAGVLTRQVEGRSHRLTLTQAPLDAASTWMERQRELWERKFEVVESYLEEREQPHDPKEDA